MKQKKSRKILKRAIISLLIFSLLAVSVVLGVNGYVVQSTESRILSPEDACALSDVDCIYVEAVSSDGDCALRYWVSVETGLLVAAEKLFDDETVYRMGALTIDQMEPSSAEFTLPNGNQLI